MPEVLYVGRLYVISLEESRLNEIYYVGFGGSAIHSNFPLSRKSLRLTSQHFVINIIELKDLCGNRRKCSVPIEDRVTGRRLLWGP